MGSFEILVRNCEAITRNIAGLRTPSPLTSSISSDTSSSSSSLLTDIEELTLEELLYRVRNQKDVYFSQENEAKGHQTSEALENDRTSKTSYNDSLSLLKLNLRVTSSEVEKLANPVVLLDRKPCDKKKVCKKCENVRAVKIPKMCSSAPETMRLEKQTYEQSLHDFTKDLKKPLTRHYEDSRGPKYLQPLRNQSRDIFRSNAPPLSLTDKKIVELLRRGSISAREGYKKKSSNAPLKVAGLRKPTGIIIQNLSSGSEDDNSTSDWIIRSFSGSKVTKFANKTKANDNLRPRTDSNRSLAVSEEIQNQQTRRTREIFDPLKSTRSVKSIQKSLGSRTSELIDEIETSDHLESARSVQSFQKSLQTSMAELKNVLNNIDLKSRETRQMIVPKLEIKSQDYSQSTSTPSREDSTRRSLDMNALIRALSDVSLRQKKLLESKNLTFDRTEDSTEPKFSTNTSATNGSRQSIVTLENNERRQKNNCHSLSQYSSQGPSRNATKCCEKNFTRSKIPIIVGEKNDKNDVSKIIDVKKKCERKIDDHVKPDREFQGNVDNNIPATRNNVNSHSTKIIKLYSPPMRENRELKSPKISKIDATREKTSMIQKNLKSSEIELPENYEKKHNEKSRNVLTRVSSEPLKNDRKMLKNNVSSRSTSSTREKLPKILQPRSSDEKFRYLRRGSQIPCVTSSFSSFSSDDEESELQQTVIKSGKTTDCQSGVELKRKFKIYEDTDESSPTRKSTEKLNTTAIKEPPRSCRGKVLTEIKNSELHSSPEDSIDAKNSHKSNNFVWTETSSEMNRAISSSFDSNEAIESAAHSSSNSPKTVVKLKKSSTSSCRSFSRISSSVSRNVGGLSDSPRYHYYDENARMTCKNLVEGAFEDDVIDTQQKKGENLFSATAIAKRLSYSEMKEEPVDNDLSNVRSFQESPEISPAEESIDNSSQMNLTTTGRSEGAVELFRKTFDSTASRVSSSLSRLSPQNLKKESAVIAAKRRSQDHFAMTISESDSEKFSSTTKILSGCKNVEPKTYKLTNHPSLLRLASKVVEPETMEIIESDSYNRFNDFPNRRIPKIRRLLGFTWRKSGKEKNAGLKMENTRILYRNNKCRSGSVDGSCESSKDQSKGQFNRNGLWVEGLEGKLDVEEDKLKKYYLPSEKAQQNNDSFSVFLANTDKLTSERVLNEQAKNSINPMILEGEPEIDPGCLCARFCLFLIGGNVHHRHNSSFAVRNRRSKIRRSF